VVRAFTGCQDERGPRALSPGGSTGPEEKVRSRRSGFAVPVPALVSILVVACSPAKASVLQVEPKGSDRPNILLIVVDDMGYSDLGSFGGEIETPNLDRLAYEGIRFSNFHTSTMCSPSRAMLLTGVDSHRAGFGNMLEELAPNQKGKPGYEGHLNDRVVTLPTLLRDAGYRTYMTGKWHLGSGNGRGPAWHGFDHSFALETGGASHFADMQPAYAPTPESKANYSEDGVRLEALPDDFHYSSQYYVDRMIAYLDTNAGTDKPFFAYLAFTAPHWPLQAPDQAIARQRGHYDDGYDALAAARLARQKELGLLPQNAVRSGRSPKEKPWKDLGPAQRKVEIRTMEVYAAMVDEVNRHVGRLIDFLESRGELDDTAIIFISDNGPEGHDLDETWPMESFPDIRKTIDTTHDFSYAAMGRPGSYVLYGPSWANAVSPAFRLHKGFPTEGGTHVAAFARYPGFIDSPRITDEFVFITDVTPTILALAGIRHPGDEYHRRTIEPLVGRSFLPLLRGERLDNAARVTAVELLGKRAIRKGDWKIMHMPVPYGTGDWQLFNLAEDLAESTDLASDNPDETTALRKAWHQYAEQNGVIIPDWVSGY